MARAGFQNKICCFPARASCPSRGHAAVEHIFIPSYQDMHCSNSWNTIRLELFREIKKSKH